MNLKNYRKEFSIFIYNQDSTLARLLRECLVGRGYEAHYHGSEELLKQAIYLALPHIVVLPFDDKAAGLIADIRKISKEIQLILVGDGADEEAMNELVARAGVYDYVCDPVRYAKTFAHRVDKAVEKWLISLMKEQNIEASAISATTAAANEVQNLDFVENVPLPLSQESLLYDLLSQSSETDAIGWTLEKLQVLTKKDFAYLKYNAANETLELTDISTGMTAEHANLGMKLEGVVDKDRFFQHSPAYKTWTQFFSAVFKTQNTTSFVIRSSGGVIGVVVALDFLVEEELKTAQKFITALGLMLDNYYKSRLLYDHLAVETKTFCLTSKAFYDKLNAEVSRARRLNLPVSTISFDLRGEVEHALTLQQLVARVLKKFTRVTDLVARISDSQFAVALPHTSLENAGQKAATLLSIIKAAIEERPDFSAKVAAGVNEFPENVSDSMSLLEGSEEAAEQADDFEVLVYHQDNKRSDLQL